MEHINVTMLSRCQKGYLCAVEDQGSLETHSTKKAAKIVESALREGRGALLEPEALTLCRIYRIPVQDFRFATNPDEAAQSAQQIGFPVVLKVVSPDISHKTEAGGVVTNLETQAQVRKAFLTITNNAKERRPHARIRGVLVQKMSEKSVEVIVGSITDRSFGPVLMFGLGGIFVEVIRDVAWRAAPVDEQEALSMLREIKGYPVLAGYRGTPQLDEKAVADIIIKLSHLVTDLPKISQVDMNPVMLFPRGATVLDAKMFFASLGVKAMLGKKREEHVS